MILQRPVGRIAAFGSCRTARVQDISQEQRHAAKDATGASTVMILPAPDADGLSSAVRFLPGGRCMAVPWRDARMHIFDPEAMARELAAPGLAWPVGPR